ncbi:hypothetical protein HanHA300_Chr02g0067871 [Helianthus annuus]|nr:hypothetical protein HanHA300_Chr02g0067871 [Helianthus annuus]
MWHLLIYDFCFFSSLFNILKLLERTVTKKQIRTRTAVKQLSSLHVLKEDTRDWREENLSTHIPPRIMKKFF